MTEVLQKNTLHNFRVINRGITLYSVILSPTELDDDEKSSFHRLVLCLDILVHTKQKVRVT